MKKVNWMVVSLFLFAATVAKAQAQSADSAGHRTNTQIIDFILNWQETRVMALAEAMPAEKYSFAPTDGEFKGVRTFAQQLVHIAADNYSLGSGILREKPPVNVGDGESGDTSLRTDLAAESSDSKKPPTVEPTSSPESSPTASAG